MRPRRSGEPVRTSFQREGTPQSLQGQGGEAGRPCLWGGEAACGSPLGRQAGVEGQGQAGLRAGCTLPKKALPPDCSRRDGKAGCQAHSSCTLWRVPSCPLFPVEGEQGLPASLTLQRVPLTATCTRSLHRSGLYLRRTPHTCPSCARHQEGKSV